MILVAVLLICIGVILVAWGIRALRGEVNVWLVDAHKWGYVSSPYGLMMFFLGVALLPFTPDDWRLWVILIGVVIMVIGLFFPHRFLDPPWMQWLKQEHGAIMPLLQREIDKMGFHEWNRRIKTQKELEEWVQEVQHKPKERDIT